MKMIAVIAVVVVLAVHVKPIKFTLEGFRWQQR